MYNGIIFILQKKEILIDFIIWIKWRHSAKGNKQGQMLYDFTYMRYLEESIHRDRSQSRVYKGLGRRVKWELLFNGYRVSFWNHNNLLEMDDDDAQ